MRKDRVLLIPRTLGTSLGTGPEGISRMRDVLDDLIGWWQAGETVGMGTVVATWRSAPRPAGASMLVATLMSSDASRSLPQPRQVFRTVVLRAC